MILYNVTVSVENDIREQWLGWMKQVHIPEVMASGYFSTFKLLRLVQPVQEHNSSTFTIQYFCADLEKLEQYWQTCALSLQALHQAKFKDKALAFRTVMEEI